MSTPTRQTHWCKWPCLKGRACSTPLREFFGVYGGGEHVSVSQLGYAPWTMGRHILMLLPMSFVLLPIPIGCQSEDNWFHSCVSFIYTIPSFVVFMMIWLGLFLFLYGLYPYMLYTVHKTNMRQTWWHPHKTTILSWSPSVLNLQACGPQHVTVHQTYMGLNQNWLPQKLDTWWFDDAWCLQTSEFVVPRAGNAHINSKARCSEGEAFEAGHRMKQAPEGIFSAEIWRSWRTTKTLLICFLCAA